MEKSVIIDQQGLPIVFDYEQRIYHPWDKISEKKSFDQLNVLNEKGDRALGQSIILPASFLKSPLESIEKDFQRFNMMHQGRARMLSPAESIRFTQYKLPVLYLGPDRYFVEARLDRLTQEGGLFRSILSSELNKGIDGQPTLYYDSVEKKAFTEFPADAHERSLYKLKLPGSIAEMDPVGHALRAGAVAGLYLLNGQRISLNHVAEVVPFTAKEFTRLYKPPQEQKNNVRKNKKNRSQRR